ncbi:MAG: hypothetical protein ACK2UP_08605 [Candidatus Promineifilaceae bacterium]
MNQKENKRDIELHIKALTLIIAVGTVIFSTMLLIGGTVLLPILISAAAEEMTSAGPLEAVALGLSGTAVVFALANLCLGLSAAYGLYKRRPWGRVLAMIDSSISLFSFPIGTIVGAYGLWVLLPEDAALYLNEPDPHTPGKLSAV